jgi:hypothetical protein
MNLTWLMKWGIGPVALLREAANVSAENVERAMTMAHKTSMELRAAEDRIIQLEAEVERLRTRVYAFVHIANIGLAGFPVAELYNIDFAQTDVAARAIAENADMVLGAKVRMSENVIAKHGLEPLKRAISACEKAGTGANVMCHIGGVETRALMSQILDLLRPGAGDDLQHLRGCCLLLQRLAQIATVFLNVVEEPHVLDRDHSLVGKGLEQLRLSPGEGTGGGSCDRNRPDRLALAEHRHGKVAAIARRLVPAPGAGTRDPSTRPGCRRWPGSGSPGLSHRPG